MYFQIAILFLPKKYIFIQNVCKGALFDKKDPQLENKISNPQ